jgi:hypothetical protein
MMKHKLNIEGIILDTQKDSNTQIIHPKLSFPFQDTFPPFKPNIQ